MFVEHIVKTEFEAGQNPGVMLLKSSFVPMVIDFVAKCGHRWNSAVNA